MGNYLKLEELEVRLLEKLDQKDMEEYDKLVEEWRSKLQFKRYLEDIEREGKAAAQYIADFNKDLGDIN